MVAAGADATKYPAACCGVVYLDDAIQVKGQKATRDHQKHKENQVVEVDCRRSEAVDTKELGSDGRRLVGKAAGRL
jgi:hypothetical protein